MQIAPGTLHKYLTGEVVTGDDASLATNINKVFEAITTAYNETDLRAKDTNTKAEADAKFYSKAQLDAGQLDNRYYTEAEMNALLGNIIPDGRVFSTKTQMFVATEGQSVFTLTEGSYALGLDRLQVYVDGIKQYVGSGDFTETSATVFTLSESVIAGTKVEATWLEGVIASSTDPAVTVPPVPVSFTNGLQVYNNSQASPLQRLNIQGRTLVNLLGRDGNCEDVSKWTLFQSTLALDATNKTIGSNSLKTTISGAFTEGNGYTTAQILFKSGKKYVLIADLKNGTATNISVAITGQTAPTTTLSITDTTKFNVSYKKFTFGADVSGSVVTRVIGTNGQYAYADAIRVYEITDAEYTAIDSLTTAQIATKYPYIDDVKHINAPYVIKYGENLLPPLNEFNLNSGSPTVISPYSGTVSTTDKFIVYIPVVAGQTYSVSATSSDANGRVFIAETGGVTKVDISGSGLIKSENFTVGAGISQLEIRMLGLSATATTISNPMLNLGATAKSFKQRNDDMLAFPNVQLASSLDGTVYDTLFQRDGKYFRENRFLKDTVLDGSLTYFNVSDGTGSKQFSVALSNSVSFDANAQVIKYDGKILTNMKNVGTGAGFTNKDDFNVWSDGSLYVRIADTDSGWGENYNPTAQEIQAYFYGYVMLQADGNPYSSGTKYWQARYNGIGTPITLPSGTKVVGTSTTTLPTTMSTQGGFVPYKLTYQLATPTFEEIQVDAGMTLHEGLNQIEVGQALVVRERAYPTYHVSWGSWYYINSKAANLTASQLANRASKIVRVTKNGRVDSNWVISTNGANDYGTTSAAIPYNLFDPTATYEVTYLALDQYLLSNTVQSVTGETAGNAKTLGDTLAHNQADQNARISALEIRQSTQNGGGFAFNTVNTWIG